MNRARVFRTLGLALGIGAIALGGWRAFRHLVGEPSPRLAERWHEGHRVVDRNGALLREIPSSDGARGQSLSLEAMGERLVAATIVSEDQDFFAHDGVDRGAILRAAVQNVKHVRTVSGASTITQQLVKLLDGGGRPMRRSLADKLLEAARAQNLESVLSKESILESYMNRLPYGHGLVGPEAAARGYFGVSARELSWAQAAYLAVLPRAPAHLDPYAHPERVEKRQRTLLVALADQDVLGAADLERAQAEVVAPRPLERPFHAPHFVESLRASGRLEEGGATTATLDVRLQRDVEGLVRMHVAAVADRGADDAAAVVVDNLTGDVLAWVGSADFHDPEISGQVDMARARRQPGSTLKPFVYAMAFARGHTPAEMVADVPTSFDEDGRGAYAPQNFDGGYLGPVTAREALAGSLNVPAVRLAAELPRGALLDGLRNLGFDSLDRDASHYGLSLALGSGEVTLLELAEAYMALARGGEAIEIRTTADDPPARPRRVLDASVAALVTDSLSDPLARVRGLRGRGPFDLGFDVAVKTGTSSGHRDTWSVGYTRERTVAVWVGNADATATLELTGASGAGPLFADVMRRSMSEVPRRAPLIDAGALVTAEVCPLSGKPRGAACPGSVARKLAPGHAPTESCDLHVHVAPRPEARPAEPPWRCDASARGVAVVLPQAFDAWLASQPPGAPGHDADGSSWWPRSLVPGCTAQIAASAGAVKIVVDGPAPGSVLLVADGEPGDAQRVEARATIVGAGPRPRELEFVIDGAVVARSREPFTAHLPLVPGDHELIARPVDPAFAAELVGSRFSVR